MTMGKPWEEILDCGGRLRGIYVVQDQQPAIVLPEPGQDGGDLFFLGAGRGMGQAGEIKLSQLRQSGSQRLGRIGHYEQDGLISVSRAPGVLDGEASLADAAKAVDGLGLGDGGGGGGTLEVGFQGAELFVAAFEEVSEGEEGEVVDLGAAGWPDRSRYLGSWSRGLGRRAADLSDQALETVSAMVVPEIGTGPLAEESGKLFGIRAPWKKD